MLNKDPVGPDAEAAAGGGGSWGADPGGKTMVATIEGLGKAGEGGGAGEEDRAQVKTLGRRSLKRQFLAGAAAQFTHFCTGVCMAYSSSLIPALEAADSEIPVTRDQSAWLASSVTLCVPVGSALSMTVNGVLGRLALIRLSLIPFSVGWALIASATSFEMLIVGRLMTGISIGLFHSPTVLFVTEVATKHIRGGLGAIATSTASLGIVLCYVMGKYMHWRAHAWANCAIPVLPCALQLLLASESPVWLKARGRDAAAAKSSTFYYGDANMILSGPSAAAGKESSKGNSLGRQFRMLFTDPLAYKPFVLVVAIFIIQQLVGVYITIYYAVTFFAETGSDLDAYTVSILIGVVRFAVCTSTSLVMSRFGRRPLMIISSVGQAVALLVSGYATATILDPETESMSGNWVMVGLLAYIALGCVGWQVIPWSMMAELFPHEVRGLAQPVNSALAHLFMFAMLQAYPTIAQLVGGSAGIQFLFAGLSAFSAVFVFVFLPETRGRTLPEIEDYFRNNVVFLTERRRRRCARRAAAQAAVSAAPASINGSANPSAA